MAIFVIRDCRGGESDEHPGTIAENQVAVAQDIDYWRNTLGGRRNGSVLALQGLAAEINSLIRFQPAAASEGFLWTLDENGDWVYYDTAYAPTAVVPSPADTFDPLEWATGVTLHGKLFIAASTESSSTPLNRLHVWDGTTLRRTGLRAPALAPAVANTGAGGVSGTRLYRVRYAVLDGAGAVLRRSEPSPEVEFTPSGSGAAVRVTKPAAISEGETHWEVETSGDDGATWYRIATVLVGTTTYDDTIDLPQNIALDEDAVLSADIGDYALQQSYRWLVADRDRILGFGNFTDASKGSRVEWTPVGSDTSGVGNDERVPVDTGNFLDLDGEESGDLTGAAAFDGRIFAFKMNRVYSLTQTGNRNNAYLPQIVSSTYGALPGSIVEGVDARGRAALYFVDPELGPMRLGAEGFEVLAPHLRDKFLSEVNFDAAYRVVNAVYHPGRGQVWWHFAGLREFARGCCPPPVITPDWPSFRWVYHVQNPGGSVFQSLPRLARSTALWLGKPVVTCEGAGLVRCDEDEAPDDYGEPFRAYFVTRAYDPGNMVKRNVVRSAMVEGRAIGLSPGRRLGCETPDDVELAFTIIRDHGIERSTTVLFNLNQEASENYVIKRLDNARMAESTCFQLEVGDAEAVSQAPWVLFKIGLNVDLNGSNVS